jgi:transposase
MPSRAQEKVLFEAIWARAESVLPPRAGSPKGGRPWASDKACLWGILFLLRSGCRWNDLDDVKGCPSSVTCWRRYAEWTKAGVWDRLFQVVLDEYQKTVGYDVRELFGDATFVEDRKGGS